jgi:hypothetical protein
MTGRRSATTGRRVLVAVAAVTAVVAVVIVATIPRGPQERSVTAETAADALVQVRIVIEEIDANRGSMRVRVAAAPATDVDLPPEGVSVLADVEGLEPLHVEGDSLTLVEGEGDIRFDGGSVAAYPFDRYDGNFAIVAVPGAPKRLSDVVGSQAVPMSLTIIEATTGFDVAADPDESFGTDVLGLVDVDYVATRSAPVTVWASTMMAIYWLLTAAVVGVVLVTVLGFREWETRHLAWLAAMIFAFTSFRAAAPGSPPIGVYFDFASFFWAELIVAVGLATMVVKYLVGRDIPGADGGSEQDGPIDTPIDEPGPARSGRPGLGPPS